MAIQELKWLVVDVKPVAPFQPFTVYFVKEAGKTKAQMYKSNLAGDDLVEFGPEIDGSTKVLHIGDTAPAEAGYKFWYDNNELQLYVNLTPEGGTDNFVNANTPGALPSFAGNGEAETMARSDHYHEGTRVTNPKW